MRVLAVLEPQEIVARAAAVRRDAPGASRAETEGA
jgi:hypothetical protein